jgi:hypothetical protein
MGRENTKSFFPHLLISSSPHLLIITYPENWLVQLAMAKVKGG